MSATLLETGLLDAALQYHANGWPALPVDDNKRPLVKWGEWLTRPQTEAELAALPWDQAHGVAVLTWPGSPLVVLDFDGSHCWDAWRATGISLPVHTATITTRSGGEHAVFRMPSGIPRPNGNGSEPRRKVRLVAAQCGCASGTLMAASGRSGAPRGPTDRSGGPHGRESFAARLFPRPELFRGRGYTSSV